MYGSNAYMWFYEGHEEHAARHNLAFDPDEQHNNGDIVYGNGNRTFSKPHNQRAFKIRPTGDCHQRKDSGTALARAFVATVFVLVAMVVTAIVTVLVFIFVLNEEVQYRDVLLVGDSQCHGQLTLTNETWNADLSNRSSVDFQELEDEFILAMDTTYRKSNLANVYNGTSVSNFRQGSVIVDFIVHLTGPTPSVRILNTNDEQMSQQIGEATYNDVISILNSEANDGTLVELPVADVDIIEVLVPSEIVPGSSENQPPESDPPSVTCPDDITEYTNAGQSTTDVFWNPPIATDRSGHVVLIESFPVSGSEFQIGRSVVTVLAYDDADNIGICTFTVSVEDKESPTIVCPENLIDVVDESESSKEVFWEAPVVGDNSGGEVEISYQPAVEPGSSFLIGVTEVTATATDPYGNSAECSFSVEIIDEESPLIICPPNVSESTDPGLSTGTVKWSSAVATDNSESELAPVSDSQPGDYEIGQHVITYTVEDPSGNIARCEFYVTVVDLEVPTVLCPSDVMQSTDLNLMTTNVTWSPPSAVDNSGQIASLVSDVQPGLFRIGVTVVTYVATDPSENEGNCSFTVTVYDGESPSLTCPEDVIVEADSLQPSVDVSWPPASATDNSGLALIDLTSDLQPGLYAVGQHIVTYTATDQAGNSANCSFEVSVIDICGTNPLFPTTKIVSGEEASPGSWPWQAFLQFRGTVCGAVLISNQWVVTAAHCISEPGVRDGLEAVIIGEVDLLNGTTTRLVREVAGITSHPGFLGLVYDNDIALLELSEPLPYDEYVRPACLKESNFVDEENHYTNCYITGWGYTQNGGSLSTKLLQARISLVNQAVCSSQLGELGFTTVTKNMICAGSEDGNESPCQGDSGGPLVCQEPDGRWTLVGIASWGYECGQSNAPSVFTRIPQYVDYINSVVNHHDPAAISCEAVPQDCRSSLSYPQTFSSSQDVLLDYLFLVSNYTFLDTCAAEDVDSILCGYFFRGCSEGVVPCRGYCEGCGVDAALCSDLPFGSPDQYWCVQGQDYCGDNQDILLIEDVPYFLTNQFFPSEVVAQRDCVWFISAEENHDIIVKFSVLEIYTPFHTLSVGVGADPDDRTSIVATRYQHTELIVIKSKLAWLKFGTNRDSPYIGFALQFIAADHDNKTFPCTENSLTCGGVCLPDNWICDGVEDCPYGEDEVACLQSDYTFNYVLNSTEELYFFSPGFPSPYPANLNASWTFSCPEDYVLKVTIMNTDTRRCCDIIVVHEGDGRDLLRWSGIYGADDSPTVTSTGSVLHLNFQTDGDDVRSSGFWGKVERLNVTMNDIYDCGEGLFHCNPGVCLPTTAVCDNVIHCYDGQDEVCEDHVYVNSSYYFTSPNYPSLYWRNYNYIWYFFTTPDLQLSVSFTSITTESGFDFVEVGEDDGTSLLLWSGGPADGQLRVVSSGSNIWVTLTTDDLLEAPGFAALVEVTNITQDELSCGDDFNCANGVCLPYSKVCDSFEYNCGNEEDEVILNCCDFICDDGMCITQSQMCDGFSDCTDGEDENFDSCGGSKYLNISEQLVISSPNHPNGYPLNTDITWTVRSEVGSHLYLEIGPFDTEAGSDYMSVSEGIAENSTTLVRRWSGMDDSLTVSFSQEVVHISFYSDDKIKREGFQLTISSQSSVIDLCPAELFSCGNGACFRRAIGCDTEINCGNEADKEPCPDPSCFVIPDHCQSSLPYHYASKTWEEEEEDPVAIWNQFSGCHPKFSSLFCWMLYPECRDSTGDVYSICLETCQDILDHCGEVIENATGTPIPMVCEGLPSGNSTFCLEEFEDPCYHQEYHCGDDMNSCIPKFRYCDGVMDCPNSFDEFNCSSPCNTFSQFDCNDGTCIPQTFLCDGVEHCSSGIDEIGCPVNISRCSVHQFNCGGGICIDNSQVCDGVDHCPNGEDEEQFCDTVVYIGEDNTEPAVSPNYPAEYPNNTDVTWIFTTDPGVQILLYFADFNTERGYDFVTTGDGFQPPSHMILGWSGYDPTVSALSTSNHLWLQFRSDASYNDAGFVAYAYAVRVAANDSLTCEGNQFSCGGYACIPSSAVCDGVASCGNGDDESNCTATDHCSVIPSDCQPYLPYDTTVFPNYAAANESFAESILNELMTIASCHDDAMSVICASLYPDCRNTGVIAEPCNTTCYHVIQSCEEAYFNRTEDLWPFECSRYGYSEQQEDGFCLSVKYLVTIPGDILMNGSFTEDLLNSSSSTYQTLESQFVSESNSAFEDSSLLTQEYIMTDVIGFSPGSIKISFNVYLNQLKDSDLIFTANLVSQILLDAIEYGTHFQNLPLLYETLSISPASVIDNEPPQVISCPRDIRLVAVNEQFVNVSWKAPEFQDNSGLWFLQEGPHVPYRSFEVNTINQVWYVATDTSGNQAICHFTVTILPYICEPTIEVLEVAEQRNISTPFFPSNYPIDIVCVFNFTAPPGLRVLTEFLQYGIGSAELVTEIGTFTGFALPLPLISATSQSHMRFVSPLDQFSHMGFYATVTAVNVSDYEGLICNNGGQILPKEEFICDGVSHCLDNSDESDCGCKDGDFTCYGTRKCLQDHRLCDGIRDCAASDDEINCHQNCDAGNVTLDANETITIQSPRYPGLYFTNMECAWLFTVPEDHKIIVQINALDLSSGDVLFIGQGSDFLNMSSTLHSLTEFKVNFSVPIDNDIAWIRFSSGSEVSDDGFSLEVKVLSPQDFARETFQCYSGDFIIKSSLCDGTNDCADFADEDQCPPCVDVPDSNCLSLLPYQVTIFPHHLAESPEEAANVISDVSSVSHCHPNVSLLFCSALFPDCPYTGPVQRPCRSFCVNVTRDCKAEYERVVGKRWPVDCGAFDDHQPVDKGGLLCDGGSGDIFNTEICGTRLAVPPRGRVVGGIGASQGDWPWMISLTDSDGALQCGGTLITEKWAITAAHCIGYISKATFGDLYLSVNSPFHQESTFTTYRHPSYNSITKEHDIALLELHTPVNFTDYVRPACLTTVRNETDTYRRCYVTGWGHLQPDADQVPDRLQEALTKFITAEQCYRYIGTDFYEELMLCAGYEEGGIDACQGDSGGPLACEGEDGRWHLVGVTSFGYSCALPYLPGVYTRISTHLDFIETVIEENG